MRALDSGLERGVETVLNELRVLQQLNIPGVLAIQECGHTDPETRSRPYLVFGHFEGQTLEAHVAKHGPLKPEDLPALAVPFAEALTAAHAHGILHRSLKPACVLVRPQPHRWDVRLTDFGLTLDPTQLADASIPAPSLLGASRAASDLSPLPNSVPRNPGPLSTRPRTSLVWRAFAASLFSGRQIRNPPSGARCRTPWRMSCTVA